MDEKDKKEKQKMITGGPGIDIKKLGILTAGGGAVFWAASVVTSLLPVAAEYRAAFSTNTWSPQAVWIGSALIGMIIALCVSFFLLRMMKKDQGRNPIRQAMILSLIALAAAILLIDIPQSFFLPGVSDVWQTFITGCIFNLVRFLLLGLAIGCFYKKVIGPARAAITGMGKADQSRFQGDEK